MGPITFMKMHGAGNDFVVIDRRRADVPVTPALARALGDRHRGVGFDQLATIDAHPEAAAELTFWNADGSISGACGNATRCIAEYLMAGKTTSLTLKTERGFLDAEARAGGLTAVNMGPPVLDWQSIPLARDVPLDALPIPGAPVATGMGNPHCTFFVDDVDAVDLSTFGPAHEHHQLFPERTNVQVAQRIGKNHLRMRVWERGVGVTLASGSSSCAVAVAALRRGLTGPQVRVDLDGGVLQIDWRDTGVWMTGPTSHVYTGTLTSEWLADLQ